MIFKDYKENIGKLNSSELWRLFGMVKKELFDRGLVRTKNMVGERGEFIAVEHYSNTPNMPNLQIAPEGTQNIDAISRKGERYSVKTITFPNKTTGVFYGVGDIDEVPNDKKFEYVLVVVINDDYSLKNIYEFDWDTFLRIRKWHKTMRAWNITLSANTINLANKVFPLVD